MIIEGHSKRVRERVPLKLPVVVTGRDDLARTWTETSHTVDASSCGAGFTLRRAVEPGRLLQLSLPLPGNLRAFDYFKKDYRMWAVVRYTSAGTPDKEGTTYFTLGVAFVGPQPPDSYLQDPTSLYELKPVRDRWGLWVLRARPRALVLNRPQPREERQPLAACVRLELFNENGQVAQEEACCTRNVSTRGMAVTTRIKAPRGSFVRVTELLGENSTLALTRACRSEGDGWHCLHLEIINGAWSEEALAQAKPSESLMVLRQGTENDGR